MLFPAWTWTPAPLHLGFPGGASSEEPACHCSGCKRRGFHPWVGKIHWRRAWQPTPVFLPGKSHAQSSLASYGPWGPRVGRNWSSVACRHARMHHFILFFSTGSWSPELLLTPFDNDLSTDPLLNSFLLSLVSPRSFHQLYSISDSIIFYAILWTSSLSDWLCTFQTLE